ncbi:MAG: RIP metalloprotease RseP [Bacteroidota bacterium]|nr:RIP metalloprotease RseP [Bacteroidota bacterium]
MVIFIKIVQLLLSLSILVIFHEFGHFIAAKIFKIKVEKFYLFFDPWFSLFKFKIKDTEYGVGWLPLGGYVKIAGMIDESMDVEQMKQPPKPWEFRSKPAWQRLIVMIAGVTVNLILAIVIYIGLLLNLGERYLPSNEVKYGIAVDSMGYQMGLRNGDKILSIDNKYVEDFSAIPKTIILDEAKTIQINRDGRDTSIAIPKGIISKLIKTKSGELIIPRFPFEAAKFSPGSTAEKAGMKVNDRIIGVNDSLVPYFDEFRMAISKFKNQKVNLKIIRGKDTLILLTAVSAEGRIGVYPKDLSNYFNLKEKKYNALTAIPAGCAKAFIGAGNYLKSIKLIFSQEKAYESVGGFIAIGNIFPGTWDWISFWSLTAFLSIMLAILNILPIPGLDGGHVMFVLYEIIFRRKPGDKFLEYAQIGGMIFLIGLLIFANLNDILKLFH